MIKPDDAFFEKMESEIDEFHELIRRKRWLLFHHTDFLKELKAAQEEFEKLPVTDNPLEIGYSEKELTLIFQEVGVKLPTNRRRPWESDFMKLVKKYELLQVSKVNDQYELAKLRALAKAGGWYMDKELFDRDAWWYELREKLRATGKSGKKIAEKTVRPQNKVDIFV